MNNKPLTFVADESCDFAVVRALRKAGFKVLLLSWNQGKSESAQSDLKRSIKCTAHHNQMTNSSLEVARGLFDRISNHEFVEESVKIPGSDGTRVFNVFFPS